MDKQETFLQRLFHHLWSLFLNGLLTILPITLTITIFNISLKLITSWLKPLREFIKPTFLEAIPHAEIILAILLIFLVGTIVKIFILRSIIHALEDLLFKIPIIRPVYSGIKQLVQAFSIQDKITFKKVVLVEFPRKGINSIGFLTSELPRPISPLNNQKFFNVFIPTTPNPTSGYFIIVAEQDIKVIDLTRQEAMAMIISGGIIQPERFMKEQKPNLQ